LTGSVVGTEAVDEPAGRGVQVEEADRLVAGHAEPVHDVGRGRDEGSWAGDARLVPDEELDLPLEDVEAVRVVGVGMRVDALEGRAEGHVDRGQLWEVAEDPVRARFVLVRLCIAGGGEDGVRERTSSVRRRVVLIEAALPAAAQDVAEAGGRRVDVEKDRGRVARVAKGVDDVGRRGGEGSGQRAHGLLLGAQRELDLALEHVERVRVVVVDVRVGALLARLVAEPGDDERLEVGENPECPLGPVRSRLALAGR